MPWLYDRCCWSMKNRMKMARKPGKKQKENLVRLSGEGNTCYGNIREGSREDKTGTVLEVRWPYTTVNKVRCKGGHDVCTKPDWKYNWSAPWNPSDHHSAIVLWGLRWAFDCTPIMLRDTRLSDSQCKLFQSGYI